MTMAEVATHEGFLRQIGLAGIEQNEDAVEPIELLLPPWEKVQAAEPPCRNPPLIHGVVRRGHVMLLAGKGKGAKTWAAIQLAVAVAMGGEWFGYRCEQGDCLYIDPELDKKSLDNRFHDVCEACNANPASVDARVQKWCLRGALTTRGFAPTIADIASDIETRCSYGDFSLVILDSASCFIAGDENSAGDVRRFFAHVLRIAEVTGAAVLVVHHMGKGAKGGWESIERSRGSAVWGDAPDAPLSLLEIFPPNGDPSDFLSDGDRAFVLDDSGLREFPGNEPRHVIFHYPTHRLDREGITDGWKPKSDQGVGGKESGKTRQYKALANRLNDELAIAMHFIAKGIGEEGASASELAHEVFGTSKTDKVKRVVECSDRFGLFKPSRNRLNVVPLLPPVSQPVQVPTLDLDA